jgi:hypothetical protein
MKVLAVPLGFYLGVSLLVPLLRGGASEPAFVEHAVTVIVVAAAVACLVAGGRRLYGALSARVRAGHSPTERLAGAGAARRQSPRG